MAYDTTSVSAAKSQDDIRKVLLKYGVTDNRFTECWPSGVSVEFNWLRRGDDKVIRIRMVVSPDRKRMEATRKKYGESKTQAALRREDQERRRIYRLLYWRIKTKLEAVEHGIVEFEQEFLADIVLPGGPTVWEEIKPKFDAYLEGVKRLALPGPGVD